MNKKLILIIVSIFLLSACGIQNQGASDRIGKKPKINRIVKPQIPNINMKADVLDIKYNTNGKTQNEMSNLLEKIDEDINKPNITEEDIRRGWYNAKENEKKYGTPEGWIWENNGKNSRWISPNIEADIDQEKNESLCKKTAGKYIISCIDTEIENCEYVPETKCDCIEGTEWKEKQGCILIEDGNFIKISNTELMQGWYYGLPNEKKLNTPSKWIWQEAGKKSRWQNSN